LLYFFSVKKFAVESHLQLLKDYSEALTATMCRDWFRRFKNGAFDVEGMERAGKPNRFEDAELEALLNGDPCQMQGELSESLVVARSTIFMCLKALRMIQKEIEYHMN